MFTDYLRRQLSHRTNLYKQLGISRTTYCRRLSEPNDITIGELRKMIIVGELDEDVVTDWIFMRKK